MSRVVCLGRVTSPFGFRRDPINKLWREHNGIDIAAPIGTEVYSPTEGFVAGVYNHPAGGKTLILRSSCSTVRFGFCHLSAFRVNIGEQVAKGQLIAKSGNTGRSSGPHLHYSVKTGGQWRFVEAPPEEPTSGNAPDPTPKGSYQYFGGAFVDPMPYYNI